MKKILFAILLAVCAINAKAQNEVQTDYYIDENGFPTKISSSTEITTESTTDLGNGIYVVDQNVTLTSTLKISGDVKLILCDGCTLNAKKIDINAKCTLSIFGQKEGTGTLNVGSKNENNTAIEFSSGYACLNIYGGTINAQAEGAEGIDAVIGSSCDYFGVINIKGGKITADIIGTSCRMDNDYPITIDLTFSDDFVKADLYDFQCELANGMNSKKKDKPNTDVIFEITPTAKDFTDESTGFIAPQIKTGLKQNGKAIELITAGDINSEIGEIYYSIGYYGPYSTSIPSTFLPGTHEIYYAIKGKNGYANQPSTKLGEVTIEAAESFVNNDIKYFIIDSENKQVQVGDGVNSAYTGNNNITSLTIPDKVEDYTVAQIGGHAFENLKQLTSVTFKGIFTAVGEDVFYTETANNSLTLTAPPCTNKEEWSTYFGNNINIYADFDQSRLNDTYTKQYDGTNDVLLTSTQLDSWKSITTEIDGVTISVTGLKYEDKNVNTSYKLSAIYDITYQDHSECNVTDNQIQLSTITGSITQRIITEEELKPLILADKTFDDTYDAFANPLKYEPASASTPSDGRLDGRTTNLILKMNNETIKVKVIAYYVDASNTTAVTEANAAKQIKVAPPSGDNIFDENGNIDNNYTLNESYLIPGSILSYNGYAVYSDGTLTFKFDNDRPTGSGVFVYDLNTDDHTPAWNVHANDITTIKFDKSFAAARPTSCYKWFSNCAYVSEVIDIQYLNTADVTNMQSMFEDFGSYIKSNLHWLDLTNFNTTKVTDMSKMFYRSNFYILDLSSFDTHNVTNFDEMFYGHGIHSVNMEDDNKNPLATIFVTEGKWVWETTSSGIDMFGFLGSLVGGNGTAWSSSEIGITRAVIDKAGQPGYLTDNTKHPYAIFDENNGTLTFYCDNQYKNRQGTFYELNVYFNYDDGGDGIGQIYPFYENIKSQIKKVVFDKSFEYAHPSTCLNWFNGCENLTEFEGWKYLKTDNVKSMGGMFANCTSLIGLDLTELDFNSSSLEKEPYQALGKMFYNCSKLTAIVVKENWNLYKIGGANMFEGCKNLIGGLGTTVGGDINEDQAVINYFDYQSDPKKYKGYFTQSNSNGKSNYKIFRRTDKHTSSDLNSIYEDRTELGLEDYYTWSYYGTNYVFIGFTDNLGLYTEPTLSKDITIPDNLNCNWAFIGKGEPYYTITYKLDDNKELDAQDENKLFSKTRLTPELPTPVRTGYTFNGWTWYEEGITNITEFSTYGYDAGAADRTYIAQWTINKHKITIDDQFSGNGITIINKQDEYNYDSKITFKISDGYQLNGDIEVSYEDENGETKIRWWYDDNDNCVFDIPDYDVTITADLLKEVKIEAIYNNDINGFEYGSAKYPTVKKDGKVITQLDGNYYCYYKTSINGTLTEINNINQLNSLPLGDYIFEIYYYNSTAKETTTEAATCNFTIKPKTINPSVQLKTDAPAITKQYDGTGSLPKDYDLKNFEITIKNNDEKQLLANNSISVDIKEAKYQTIDAKNEIPVEITLELKGDANIIKNLDLIQPTELPKGNITRKITDLTSVDFAPYVQTRRKFNDDTTVITKFPANYKPDNVIEATVTGSYHNQDKAEKNAGEGYDIWLHIVSSDPNYEISPAFFNAMQFSGKGEIYPDTLTVSDLPINKTKVYDGATTVFLNNGDALPLTTNDNPYTLTDLGVIITSAAYNSANVATANSISVTCKSVNPNYVIDKIEPLANATISPKKLTIDPLSSNIEVSKTYDGTTDIAQSLIANWNPTINGIINNDDVKLDFTAKFNDENVGNNKAITFSLALTGEKATNYTLAEPSATVNIGEITPATITAPDLPISKSKVYDGTTTVFLTNGDALPLTTNDKPYTLNDLGVIITSAAYNSVDVATDLSISFTCQSINPNYVIGKTEPITNAAITKKPIKIAPLSSDIVVSKTYDGTTDIAQSLIANWHFTSNDIINNDKDGVTFAYTAKFNDKDVSDNKGVTISFDISGNKSGNYELAEKTLTSNIGKITPKAIAVPALPSNIIISKQYDGTTDISQGLIANISLKSDDFIDNDDVKIEFSAKYNDENVGKNKDITFSFVLTGKNAANYTLLQQTATTNIGEITPLGVNILINKNTSYTGYATIGKHIWAKAWVDNIDSIPGTYTYTPAQGTALADGKQTVHVIFTPSKEYSYFATTEADFDVTIYKQVLLEGNITQNTDLKRYCEGKHGDIELNFTISDGEATYYKIVFDKEPRLSHTGSVISEPSENGKSKGRIEFNLQSPDIDINNYEGYVVFTLDEECTIEISQQYPCSIRQFAPRDAIKQLYHNVIFVDNHYEQFVDYKWYKNNELIKGKNYQYHTEQVLDGNEYTVDLTTKSGLTIQACPIAQNDLVKALSPVVTPYPNPAKANQPFTLKIIGGVPENATIMIFNNSGAQVQRIDNVTENITLTLPQGYYSGALIYDGQKSGFKIIVK